MENTKDIYIEDDENGTLEVTLFNDDGTLRVTSFSIYYDEDEEDGLQKGWPAVESALGEHGISCELNLDERSMTVSTTKRTKSFIRAKHLLKLLSAIKILNDKMQCEVIEAYPPKDGRACGECGTCEECENKEGIDLIRKMVQSNLDKRLAMWEQYCLNHCFVVPEGFVLPKNDESPVDSTICQNAVCDPDLDAQLDLLRSNLTKVGKESAALNRELQSLERQSASSDRFSALVNETLQLYDQNSFHEMFQEMVKTASELRMKIGKLKAGKKEETKCNKTDRIYNPHRDSSMADCGKGFSDAKLEDLQEFVANMKPCEL